jgi:hypothetical protein
MDERSIGRGTQTVRIASVSGAIELMRTSNRITGRVHCFLSWHVNHDSPPLQNCLANIIMIVGMELRERSAGQFYKGALVFLPDVFVDL